MTSLVILDSLVSLKMSKKAMEMVMMMTSQINLILGSLNDILDLKLIE